MTELNDKKSGGAGIYGEHDDDRNFIGEDYRSPPPPDHYFDDDPEPHIVPKADIDASLIDELAQQHFMQISDEIKEIQTEQEGEALLDESSYFERAFTNDIKIDRKGVPVGGRTGQHAKSILCV